MNDVINLANREEVPVYEKLEEKQAGSHLVNYKRKKIYYYYKCDFCGNEIRIYKNKRNMSGGIVTIPYTITKCKSLDLALCNKCLKPMLKIFEERS